MKSEITLAQNFKVKTSPKMNVYFSDFFNVDPAIIEEYGAFNISLINDLPLFIDPFLLFNSDKKEYQGLHREILKYVGFLRDRSISMKISKGLLLSWYCFPEVKQTWLGYSEIGNGGRGPGMEFAKALNNNFNGIFADFDRKKISRDTHLEKFCLIKEKIGKDNISDFVTNLIKRYLLEYTQDFAKENIEPTFLKKFTVLRVTFNYKTSSWAPGTYVLPFNSLKDGVVDHVLLTPKDLLTKDETWINKADLFRQFPDIISSVSNDELRSRLSFYFSQNLPEPEYTKEGKEKERSKKDITAAVMAVIKEYPELLDYYIKYKEERGEEAQSISEERVQEVHSRFIEELSGFIHYLASETQFYKKSGDTLAESYERVLFLKNVIENKDGYRIFYYKGEQIKREAEAQIMFRLTWCASPSAVAREANEGRGPADFIISRGAMDKTVIEFKLASNKKLAQNLEKQVEIYKKAHDTDKSIKVIIFFSSKEEEKTRKVLNDLGLSGEKYIVLIDARNDNKPSASKA